MYTHSTDTIYLSLSAQVAERTVFRKCPVAKILELLKGLVSGVDAHPGYDLGKYSIMVDYVFLKFN